MPKLKMELGAEPKKMALLAGLLLLAVYLLYSNVFSDPETGPGPAASARPAASPARETDAVQQARQAQDSLAATGPRVPDRPRVPGGRSEFKPTLKPREGADPMAIDPSLRTDLLDRLAKATVSGSQRSLFEFGAAPRPEDIIKTQPEPKIVVQNKMIGPEPPPPPAPPPVKPPPPPINLKFYGSMSPSRGGANRVFCIDGEDILVPAEGEVIKKRYRIVRINTTSVVVEDMDHKNQQTLKIEEPPKA
ncbi:MAG: hypothetical protein C0504_01800 [Candidatus Solibacter sp.]|nr:hypothetical protein [Candidatus Solibacter sp.]